MTTKRCLIATLTMLFATMLAGCSKKEPSGVTPADMAIRLNAGVLASKAVVNNGDDFTAAIAGWESSSTVNYGLKETWLTTATITASDVASDITLGDQQYYSQNGAVKTYIKSWYPAGTLADNGVVTFGGVADGTVDVLMAREVSGSAQDVTGKTLVFNHPLTQIKFEIQRDATFIPTTTISSIAIKDAGVPTGINLITDAVNYTDTDLLVPQIDGTQEITVTKTIIGQPVMIRPIVGSTFKVDIVTSGATYSDVLITVTDNNLQAGKAYTVTLNFAGIGVSAKASVTEWEDTGVGSGDVTEY